MVKSLKPDETWGLIWTRPAPSLCVVCWICSHQQTTVQNISGPGPDPESLSECSRAVFMRLCEEKQRQRCYCWTEARVEPGRAGPRTCGGCNIKLLWHLGHLFYSTYLLWLCLRFNVTINTPVSSGGWSWTCGPLLDLQILKQRELWYLMNGCKETRTQWSVRRGRRTGSRRVGHMFPIRSRWMLSRRRVFYRR